MVGVGDVYKRQVQDMYLLDPANRRLSNLFLPKKLDRYLSKWIGKGLYHAIFDNVDDSLSLSRLQCFDFQGVNNEQYADLIEPLMVWPVSYTHLDVYKRQVRARLWPMSRAAKGSSTNWLVPQRLSLIHI